MPICYVSFSALHKIRQLDDFFGACVRENAWCEIGSLFDKVVFFKLIFKQLLSRFQDSQILKNIFVEISVKSCNPT